jgi:hypothetical protein
MIDLHRFLENPFDDEGISLSELLDFSSDHLERMIANNPGGELAARITATTSALTLVQETATDDQSKLGIRKARKKIKAAFRKAVLEEIAKVHGAIVAKYGPNAPEIAECFPKGRSIFNSAPDDRLAESIEALLKGVEAHQADLGAALVTEVSGIVAEWDTILDQSNKSSAGTTMTQDSKKLARENLQLMLFLNLLKLAAMFPRQPKKLDLFMRQSLLEDHPAQEEEPSSSSSGPVEP